MILVQIKDLKVFQFVEIFSEHLGTVHYCILELVESRNGQES